MFAVISESRGLVGMRENEQAAEDLALIVAVNTGRTVTVKPANEVTV